MFLSVVIPTYNRLPILRQCLQALEAAVRELHSYEIPEWIHWRGSAAGSYGRWCAGEVAALSPDAAPSAPAATPGDGAPAG